jgi:hypothetical protein
MEKNWLVFVTNIRTIKSSLNKVKLQGANYKTENYILYDKTQKSDLPGGKK